MLHNFLNPLKQATVNLSEPSAPMLLVKVAPGLALAAASLDELLGFTWESRSPVQLATISDSFIAQAEWPQAKYN